MWDTVRYATGEMTWLLRKQRVSPRGFMVQRIAVWWVLITLTLLVGCNAPPPTPTPLPPPTPIGPPDVLDRLREADLVRICLRVSPDAAFAPLAFRGGSNAATGGALTGFEVDLANLLAERLAVSLELVETPISQILAADLAGRCDLALAGLTPFDQTTQLTFSRPYGFLPLGILVAQGETDIRRLDDLANRTVGVLRDSSAERLLTAETVPTVQGQPLTAPFPASIQVAAVGNLSQATALLSQPITADGLTAPFDALFGPTPLWQQAIANGWPVELAAEASIVGYQPVSVAVIPQAALSIDRLLAEVNHILTVADEQAILAERYYHWYNQDFSRLP